jgi:hypothetical protein
MNRLAVSLIKSYTREILSFVKGYTAPDEKGRVTIMRTKKWPAYYIVPEGKKYKVYAFRAKQGVSKIFKKNPEKYMEKFVDHDYISWNWPSLSGLDDKDIVKQLLRESEEIMKTDIFRRDTPAETTRLIPKLFGENIFVSKEATLTKQKLFDLLVGKEKFDVSTFEELFGPVDFEETGRIRPVKYGKWTILLDEKAKRNEDDIKKLLALVSKHLGKKGLRNLAYGRLVTVDNLRGKYIADYFQADDSIRIEAPSVKASQSDVSTMLHELGHRNYYKFLSPKQVVENNFMYDKMKRRRPYIRGGDILVEVENPGNRYQVLGRKGKTYQVRLVETADPNKEVGDWFRIKGVGIGSLFVKQDGERDKEKASFFPRPYGMKNPKEFYAVLFQEWLTKGLKEPAKSWFEDLHKAA